MTKFQIGATYYDRSACDYDCIFEFTIVGRTAKTVSFQYRGETKKRGIYVYDGVEHFRPFGTYSMCTIISADKMVA